MEREFVKNSQRPQREVSSKPVQRKTCAVNGEYEYSSDLLKSLDMGTGSETLSELELDKTWYGVASTGMDSVVDQRSGSDAQCGSANYGASRSAQAVAQLPPTLSTANKNSRGVSRNWKCSEEEEYTWDDMNFRLMDHGARDNTSSDSEKLEAEHLPRPRDHDIGFRVNREATSDSKSITQRGQATSGHRESPAQSLQESYLFDTNTSQFSMVSGASDSQISSSLTRAGLCSQMVPLSASTVVLGQQQHLSPGAASPSRQSSIHQYPQSHNLSEQDRLQVLSQLAGLLNQVPQESSHIPINQIGNSHNLQLNKSTPPQHLQTPSSVIPFPQLKPPTPSLQQPQAVKMLSQFSGQSQKPLHENQTLTTGSCTADRVGELDPSSLLSEVLRNGLVAENLATSELPNLNLQELGSLPFDRNIQPSYPGEPTVVQHAASSIPMVSEASLLASATHGNASSISTLPQKTTVKPSLPPGPLPSSIGGSTSVRISSVTSAAPKSLSCLLSSLVSKGLISAATTESPTLSATQLLSQNQTQNQSPGPIISSSMLISSSPAAADILSSTGNELPVTKSCPKTTTSLSQGTTTESKCLIGAEFKPEILRVLHPSVISGLFTDFPYHCETCGLQIIIEERFDEHMEWHASKKTELSSCGMVSRKWYANLGDWIARNRGETSGPASAASTEVSTKALEESEQAVRADESQCVCVLCGELFEDYYNFLRDEWMFKGAVYVTLPATEADGGTTDGSSAQGPIVHANCISQSAVHDL